MTLENNPIKKASHIDLKERYKNLKKNPEYRMTCDEIEIKERATNIDKLQKNNNSDKLKSKHHLEEKLKTFSANLSHLKSNNDGFHKSLDLVNGLIKGLDLKIQKIREMKETSPRMIAQLNENPTNHENELVFETS